jgi:hypothetical protein
LQKEIKLSKANKLLIALLVGVGLTILLSNIIGKEAATTVTDVLYVPASASLLVLSIIATAMFRLKGDHGKSYLLFTGFVAMWFVAELIWVNAELVHHLTSFPAYDDWVYLGGYAFLAFFMIYYLKPVKEAVSKLMLTYGLLASSLFLIPTLYSMYIRNPNAGLDQIIWASIYPVSDAIVLFPAVLGLALFFRGQVSLLWSFTCIAIILNIVADSGFLFLDVDKSYYTGSPVDILYLWAYILFAFGIYSHIKLYKKPKIKSYGDVKDLK